MPLCTDIVTTYTLWSQKIVEIAVFCSLLFFLFGPLCELIITEMLFLNTSDHFIVTDALLFENGNHVVNVILRSLDTGIDIDLAVRLCFTYVQISAYPWIPKPVYIPCGGRAIHPITFLCH